MNLNPFRFRISFRVLRHGGGRSLFRAAVTAFFLAMLPLAVLANPQAKAKQETSTLQSPASPSVQHVKLLLDKGSPALEIETTAPVTPQINKSNEGMRIVIDLPNTNMSVADKVVPIKNQDLREMRLNLIGDTPPRVHVEVDFRKPLGYTWDVSGNRLRITFHDLSQDASSNENSAATAAGATPIPVSAPAPAPEYTHLVPAEMLAPGASVTAEAETTVLRLKQSGDVYVCPRTSVSVVHAKNGPDLTLAMNDGGLETHLILQKSVDEVVTPDFRILLRGPGEFDYAIRADSRGNTCVRTLPGNTASAMIYEVMGDGTYNAQGRDQLVFHEGKLSLDAASPGDSKKPGYVLPVECGCPPPIRATLLASSKPEPKIAVESLSPGASAAVTSPAAPGPVLPKNTTAPGSAAPPETGMEVPLPASVRDQPHTQVEASLTFTPNPARTAAMHLPATSRQVSSPVDVQPPDPAILPPNAPAPERHKSVFGKIKSFFSGVFQ
jgi:hypothetical protein